MRKVTRLSSMILLAFCLTACQSLTSTKDWPDNLPARKNFVNAYYQKRNVSKVDDRVMNEHLGWIIRFYQGTVIYPNGWTRVSNLFLDSIPNGSRRIEMQRRLEKLGIEIANEWAQDNAFRNINSSNMITWGSALRTAAERGDQENFVTQVETDVQALVARKLAAKAISYERYYPEQDYDDF